MLPKKISPVWLVISLVFGFAVSAKESLHPSLVALGMAFAVFGAYLIGRAEEQNKRYTVKRGAQAGSAPSLSSYLLF